MFDLKYLNYLEKKNLALYKKKWTLLQIFFCLPF